jgi:hypothetical protein
VDVLQQQFEAALFDLGAVCVQKGVTAEQAQKLGYDRLITLETTGRSNALASESDYRALRSYVLRTSTAQVWFQTIFSPQRARVAILQIGEISAEQLAERGRPFYLAPPPPPTPEEIARPPQIPIPAFDASANFANLLGDFEVELMPGMSANTAGSKIRLRGGLIQFIGNKDVTGYMLPYAISGNTLEIVDRHSSAQLRIVDRNTLVSLPVGGAEYAVWWHRLR